MATRRKHLPPPDSEESAGFPEFEHGQFTFEGEIERLGAISRNMSSAPKWTRVVAKVLAVAMLLPLVIGLGAYLVNFLTR